MTECPTADSDQTGLMRVYVRELGQLLNTIDPSPFQDRDLDAEAERFIVSWARDLPSCTDLALEVEVEHAPHSGEEERGLVAAVGAFFNRRAETSRRELRTLLRRGRTSLVIGILFLSACVIAGNFAAAAMPSANVGAIIQQGLTVAGWVAMWRPMEIFLYSWWPIVGDRRLYERLSKMPVRIRPLSASQSSTSSDHLPVSSAGHIRAAG